MSELIHVRIEEGLLNRRAAVERVAGLRAPRVEASSPALNEIELEEIREIEAALARIQKGTYGRCEACGSAIGGQRLRAVPEERFCLDCLGPRALERQPERASH